MDAILAKALEQGLGYGMFVILFIYVLREQKVRDKKSEEREAKSELREQKYQDIISKLTEKFNIIEIIQNDVKEVKNYIFKK